MCNSSSGTTLTDCVFSGNSATTGGGVDDYWSDATMTSCLFLGNSGRLRGGGMRSSNSDPTLTNCAFLGNSSEGGGGMYVDGNSVAAFNSCTFSRNTATNGNALACDNNLQKYPSVVEMVDCILWNGDEQVWNNDGSTITITGSCVQDEDPDDGMVYPGVGNIDDDPLFVLGPAGCFYLSQTTAGQAEQSPCVDAGSDTAANLELDAMTTRSDEGVDTGIVDMGYHYPVTAAPLVMGDYDRDGLLDLVDFSHFHACFVGPGPAVVSPCCRIFELGVPDDDVDLSDFAAFQLEFDQP